MRARLALAASGLEVEHREIVLRNKPAHMLQISPKGTVPVLLLPDQTVVDESIDIMYWALGQSDPEQLLPTNPALLQSMQQFISTNDGPFKRSLDRYKYPPRYTAEHAESSPEQFAVQHRDSAAQWLWNLDGLLAQHAYLLGAKLTMTDLALAPFVRQYAHTDIEWFQAQSWTHLAHWLQRFLDSERFAQVMHKYEPWQGS